MNKRKKKKAKAIPVLMYHWFYNSEIGCEPNDSSGNWISAQEFEKQMKYLHNNNYYYPSWDELRDWIDGKIDLPANSIILTDDDAYGTFFSIAMPIFQKYEIPFTSFIPTSLGYEKLQVIRDQTGKPYLTFESHSDKMHEHWDICFGKSVAELSEDIKKSVSYIGNHEVFAYPFGQYTDEYIEALRKNDFKMAFTTVDSKVKRGMNPYTLPRVRMSKDMSIEDFISAISEESLFHHESIGHRCRWTTRKRCGE